MSKAKKKAATKAPGKTKPAKKNGKAIVSNIPPEQVVISIVDVNMHSVENKIKKQAKFRNFALDETPNFSFVFDLGSAGANARIDDFTIDGVTFERPGDTGSVFADIQDTRVQIMINGSEANPGGSASFTMNFKGKPIIFNPPANLKTRRAILAFHKL